MEWMRPVPVLTLMIGFATGACVTVGGHAEPGQVEHADLRRSVISRSQLWRPTDVSTMNLRVGPEGPGAFSFHATVLCDYVDKKLGGNSPKFVCAIGKDDQVKVKFGRSNGEVYGEVLATRLLWALGFGADRMYPVNVICRGCPPGLGGVQQPGHESQFDPARCSSPLDKIDASCVVCVCAIRAAKSHAEIADHQERPIAQVGRARRLGIQTDDALLLCLAVCVLNEHSKQLERVELSSWRTSRIRAHPLELLPGPPLLAVGWPFGLRHPTLDHGTNDGIL
jgi:hypothetical protein